MIKVIRSSSGNTEVTNYYLDVIASIADQTGENKYKENVPLNQCKKEDIIIAPTAIDFLKLYIKGYKTQIYWMQGLDPEESYMRNGSKFKKFILDIITKFTLKKAIFRWFF